METFYAKQESIYSEFEVNAKLALKEGLCPDTAVTNKHGGILLAFRHLPEITEPIAEVSNNINEIIRSVIYDTVNIHTTVSGYLMGENLTIDPKDHQNILVMKDLSACVKQAIFNMRNKPIEIAFSNYLFNKNTVILKGNPNKEFLIVVQNIIENAIQKSIGLKFPWGGHITASRFIETGSTIQTHELKDLLNRSFNPKISRPFAIDIGYTSIQDNCFTFTIFERVFI